MLGFRPKLPISDEERIWIDDGFRRLEHFVGRRRMLDAQVVLPNPECFPDPYDGSDASAKLLFKRVCSYMHVDPRPIHLEIFADETDQLRMVLPYWSGRGGSNGCAGFYTSDTPKDAADEPNQMLVALRSTQLRDPLSLVATIAHELGHVILLGGGLLNPQTPDHEPLTDLLTVFLGLGIFNANASGQFKQYQQEGKHGWSTKRLGYLPQQAYGYALAKFANERGENKPAWEKYLCTNVRAYYKSSRSWLEKNKFYVAMPKPIG